jgi:hypothetical protein
METLSPTKALLSNDEFLDVHTQNFRLDDGGYAVRIYLHSPLVHLQKRCLGFAWSSSSRRRRYCLVYSESEKAAEFAWALLLEQEWKVWGLME